MECSDQQSSVKSQQNARVNSTFHHGDNGHQREIEGFCIFNLCEVTSPMQPKPGVLSL
jgi:hypothetical protein